MKIYLFDPENGVYAGETFAEGGIINPAEGVTAIAPPAYDHGQVPVFDRKAAAWAVLPISVVRQLLQSNSNREGKQS